MAEPSFQKGIKMKLHERFAAMSLAAVLAAAGTGFAVPQAAPSWDWPVSTPDEQGLDGKALAELTDLIRKGKLCPRFHALLVIRHGHLAVEEYFNNWQRDRLHTLQSVSKSFTSALVGIAIARSKFKGVDEKVLDFFPDLKDIANMDERKASMRLEDLLTMRSGTDYNEQGPDSPHFQMNRLERGEIDEAIRILQYAVSLNSDLPLAYGSLGRCFRAKGLWEEAIRHYEKALRLAPDDAEARRALEEITKKGI
jgi:CubicO group peptidase (beta-lactamase class C family)